MMKQLYLILLVALLATNATAQNYAPDEVIVKFRTATTIKVDAKSRRMASSHNAVTQVLNQLGVCEAEQLMPLTCQNAAERKCMSASTTQKAGNATQRERLVPAWSKHHEPVGLPLLYALKIDTLQTTVMEVVKDLSDLEEVEYAEPNYLLKTHASAKGNDYAVTDELLKEQWGLEAIRMPELWERPIIHERRPVIAIIDSGIDTLHTDLKNNLLPGWNVVNDNHDVQDKWDHGTNCASVAAAIGGNGGMVGANPLAWILPIKVHESNTIEEKEVIKALDYAVAQGADIISCSFGFYETEQKSYILHHAFQSAAENCIIFAAVGNNSLDITDNNDIPAGYPEVIGVMATNKQGGLSTFCNTDRDGAFFSTNEKNYNYELQAPGEDILVASIGGGYQMLSGTSFATPLAAGAVSRLLQCRDFTSREKLMQALIESCGSHLDIMSAYEYEKPLNGTFTRVIGGHDMTFRKTGENSLEIGDGEHTCLTGDLDDLIIPDVVAGYAVTSIAPNAFSHLKINAITLPYMLGNIGNKAFTSCELKTIRLKQNENLPVCAADAFDTEAYDNCTVMANDVNMETWKSAPVWQHFKTFTINSFYAVIDDVKAHFALIDAEEKTVKLEGVHSPSSNSYLAAIPTDTQGSFTLPSEIYGYQVTEVGSNAFRECSNLTSVHLPESIRAIGNNAFENCTSLTSVNLPEGITRLPRDLFYFCWNLRSISIPSTVTNIGYGCFAYTSITEIVIPDGMEYLRSGAFTFCPLTKVVLPRSMTYLDDQMFETSNPYIVVVNNPEPICLIEEGEDFDGTPCLYENYPFGNSDLMKKCILIVPQGCKEAYENAYIWQYFGTIIEGTAETEVPLITSVIVDNDMTYILYPETHTATLFRAADREDCQIPAHVTYEGEDYTVDLFGSSNFKYQFIQTLTIPATIIAMDGMAFYGCKALNTVISYIEEPFDLNDNLATHIDFHTFTYIRPARLYVPRGTKAKYEVCKGWKDFGEIIEMNQIATNIVSAPVETEERSATYGWYTISGVRHNTKPVTPGIYLHDNKKIVIQ